MYRILVMEDDADILELLRMNLQVVGYEVRTAQTGTDALHLIETLIREAQNLLGVGTPNNNGTSRPLRPKNP